MVRFHDALAPLLQPIDALKPHPRNARNGDTDAIAASMLKNGVYRPVMAQRSTGFVLAGNHAYHALLELGSDVAAVVWLDVDDDEALRILLADNRTADLGRYDDALLIELLRDMDDLGGTGYTEEDVTNLQALLDDDQWGNGMGGGTPDNSAFDPRIDLRVPTEVFEAWQRMLNTVVGKDDGAKLAGYLKGQGFLRPYDATLEGEGAQDFVDGEVVDAELAAAAE